MPEQKTTAPEIQATPLDNEVMSELFGQIWVPWVKWKDEASIRRSSVRVSELQLRHTLPANITNQALGERHDELLREGCTLLDARFFVTLLREPHLIPESWNPHGAVLFPGTQFRDNTAQEFILGLTHEPEDGISLAPGTDWRPTWLYTDESVDRSTLSAVIANS